MSLEQTLERLIVSLDANTAAHKGTPSVGAKVAATEKPVATAAAKAAKNAPTVDFEAVKAAAMAVKAKSGQPAAKKIISEVGKAESLNSVKKENFAGLLAALTAHLEGQEDEADEPADEDL